MCVSDENLLIISDGWSLLIRHYKHVPYLMIKHKIVSDDDNYKTSKLFKNCCFITLEDVCKLRKVKKDYSEGVTKSNQTQKCRPAKGI
jgi:hypothetical protein